MHKREPTNARTRGREREREREIWDGWRKGLDKGNINKGRDVGFMLYSLDGV